MDGPKRNFIAEVLQAHVVELKARGGRIEDMVRELGLSLPQINRLRRGQVPAVHMKTIVKLAEYFQWGVEETGMAVWYSDHLEPKPEPKKRTPK